MIEDVCTACGERNPAGSAFCLYCGVYLGWDQATAEQREPSSVAVQHPGPAQTPTPTGETPRQTAPAVVPQYEDVSGRPKPGEVACPQCGVPNAATLRFCSKCGKALRPSLPTTQALTAVSTQSWWQRLWDPKDRRARREYRRSLPPFYRWRRVIVGVGGLAAVLVVLSVVGKNPVSWAKDRLYDVRGTLVAVDPVVFAGVPAQSVATDYDVDGARQCTSRRCLGDRVESSRLRSTRRLQWEASGQGHDHLVLQGSRPRAAVGHPRRAPCCQRQASTAVPAERAARHVRGAL